MTIINVMLVSHPRQGEVMDEREKRQVGEQIEPGGRPKAPGSLEVLQRFVNTWNHDFPTEWDRLGTPDKARSWLLAKGLVPPETRISPREAAALRELREAVRELAAANHAGAPSPAAVRTIRDASKNAMLLVSVDASGQSALEPVHNGVPGAIATLLGILHDAQVAGAWSRLKGCRQCGYAFYDRSKNRSAAWCAMSICGNRTKNRTYRQRRSSGAGEGGWS
jgi:predicted RNA-binding Zn ribbon-like protein